MFMLVSNSTGATPTLLRLKSMRGANGERLKVVQKIAAGDYLKFGMCLLQDENGDEVELIECHYKHNGAASITEAILRRWLTSGAAPTHTYHHLIECLRVSKLGTLADDITTVVVGKGNQKIRMHSSYQCVPSDCKLKHRQDDALMLLLYVVLYIFNVLSSCHFKAWFVSYGMIC